MQPISDPVALKPGATLYHSAFGFARVRVAEPDAVELVWDRPGAHLPGRVRHDNLKRVYALCPRDGFFHRALDDHDALRQALLERPADALVWLLEDLEGPQRLRDVMDWLVGRELFTPKTFVRWWANAEAAVRSDPRLTLDGEWLHQACESPRPPGHEPGPQLDPDGLSLSPDDPTTLGAWDGSELPDAEVVHLQDPLPSEVYLPLDAVPLANARPPAAAWPPIGHALAQAILEAHRAGVAVRPTSDTALLHPDGSVHLPQGASEPLEEPQLVQMAAVALIETFIGRHLPPGVRPDRLLPHLRHHLPQLPPSALAPVSLALHPQPQRRPSAAAWLEQWSQCEQCERARAQAHRAHAMMQTAYDSHIGRVKLLLTQTNQDALFVGSRQSETLAVLADGISLSDAGSGDRASRIAVETLARMWSSTSSGPVPVAPLLDRALGISNEAICRASLRAAGGDISGRMPMGTTAIVAYAQGNRVHVASLGDSRAYVVGPFGAGLITADDNVSGEGFQRWCDGTARTWYPDGHALVRYLGHFNAEGAPHPLPAHHLSFVLRPEERLVLLSDGVTDYITDQEPELVKILSDLVLGLTPDEACRELIALANRGGGGDNATAIILAPLAREEASPPA